VDTTLTCPSCVLGISIAGEKDVTPEMLVNNFEKVLRLLPASENDVEPKCRDGSLGASDFEQASAPMEEEDNVDIAAGRSLSEDAQAFGAETFNRSSSHDDDSSERDDLCKLPGYFVWKGTLLTRLSAALLVLLLL